MNTKNKWLVTGFSLLFIVYACQMNSYLQGKRIYEAQCSNCHMEDGSGLAAVIKDISNSSYFNSKNPSDLIQLLIEGRTTSREDGLQMPSFQNQLNRVEMCNLINYLNYRWASDFEEVDIMQFDSLYNRVVERVSPR